MPRVLRVQVVWDVSDSAYVNILMSCARVNVCVVSLCGEMISGIVGVVLCGVPEVGGSGNMLLVWGHKMRGVRWDICCSIWSLALSPSLRYDASWRCTPS